MVQNFVCYWGWFDFPNDFKTCCSALWESLIQLNREESLQNETGSTCIKFPSQNMNVKQTNGGSNVQATKKKPQKLAAVT